MDSTGRSPFTLRVGQVMTGFGAGCGIGLGVGYPIALGSIPVLGDLVKATSSAGSQAFGGVGYRAFGLLKKLGLKNLKAGVGCGVGIGHGFGVGLALKPGVIQQLSHTFQEQMSGLTALLQKNLRTGEVANEDEAEKLQSAMATDTSIEVNNPVQSATRKEEVYTSSEPVASVSIPPASALRESGTKEELRQENQILRTLLRHQELIEDLKAENAALRQVLSEQFDLSSAANGACAKVESTLMGGLIRRGPTLSTPYDYPQLSRKSYFNCRRHARRRGL